MAQLKNTQITGDLVIIKDGVEMNVVDILNALQNATAKSGGYIQIERAANVTNYSSSYNGFTPFSGSDINVIAQKGNLELSSDTFSYLDRSNQTVYGVRIGAGISMVKITSKVTYVSKGYNVTVRDYIGKYRPSDGSRTTYSTASHMFMGKETERETINHTTFADVQEGDFIYIVSYKFSASDDVDVYADYHATQLTVEVVE